jgi:hypothetical protein
MKFTWKPITNIDNLPRNGEFFMMSDGRNVDFVRRGDSSSSERDKWFYCYSGSEVQNPKRFIEYFIPRPTPK